MKLQIGYIENEVFISDGVVNSVEIENKQCFYRLVNDFVVLSNNGDVDCLALLDDLGKEVGISNKFLVIIDYFNIDNVMKKYLSYFEKTIVFSIDDKDRNNLLSYSSKLISYFEKVVSKLDLPVKINFSGDINTLVKFMKFSFNLKDSLFDNLLLLIDLEKEFNLYKFLVFVNLKQYLSRKDLLELYKYSVYVGVNILLIDSQSYGGTLEYEKKIIIDSDFYEYMI